MRCMQQTDHVARWRSQCRLCIVSWYLHRWKYIRMSRINDHLRDNNQLVLWDKTITPRQNRFVIELQTPVWSERGVIITFSHLINAYDPDVLHIISYSSEDLTEHWHSRVRLCVTSSHDVGWWEAVHVRVFEKPRNSFVYVVCIIDMVHIMTWWTSMITNVANMHEITQTSKRNASQSILQLSLKTRTHLLFIGDVDAMLDKSRLDCFACF